MYRLGLIFLAALLAARQLPAEPPVVSHLVPAAVRPGQAVDLTFHGAHLAAPTACWTSFPAAAVLAPDVEGNGQQADRVVYRVEVPPDAPLGVAAIRLATREGVSGLRLLLIDDLPAVVEAADNHSPRQAQELTLPQAVDGACDAETSDYFRLAASAGQQISVEVVARRLGSPLDPLLRLLDGHGREVASSDDDPSAGVDSRLTHRFSAAGSYTLELRDVRHQGGPAFRYRLRLGDFSLPSAPFPLAVARGSSASLEYGTAGSGAWNSQEVAVGQAPLRAGRLRFSAQPPGAAGRSWLTVVATDAPEPLEQEPNDQPETATPWSTGAVHGRLLAPGDVDSFRLEGKAGQRLQMRAHTRALGSSCDAYLRLWKPDGSLLAEADDAGPDDALLDVTFPADGNYTLRVEDIHRRGGPGFVYRLEAEPYRPGFALVVEGEKFDAPAKGVLAIKVTAARRDFNGPITLELAGLPESPALANQVIPEGKNETLLLATLPAGLSPGTLGTLEVIGTADAGGGPLRVVAGNLPTLRAAWAGLPFPPAELDGLLGLGVRPEFPRFFELAWGAEPVRLPRLGAKAHLNLKLARLAGFDGDVAVAAPSGGPLVAGPKNFAKGQSDVAIEVALQHDLPPGTYPLRLTGSAVFQHQPQQFELSTPAIHVGPALSIEATPAGAIPVGGAQQLQLQLTGDWPNAAEAQLGEAVSPGAEGPRGADFPGLEPENRAAGFPGAAPAPGAARLVGTADLPADYSVELWLRNDRDPAAADLPAVAGWAVGRLAVPADGAPPAGELLGISGAQGPAPRGVLLVSAGQRQLAGQTVLPPGTWHHVVLVRSGDQVRVYLDGQVETPEIQGELPVVSLSRRLLFGAGPADAFPWSGRLDELSVYGRALPPEAVRAHYQAAKTSGSYSPTVQRDQPLAYWRLDEASERVVRSAVQPAGRRLGLSWRNLPAGVRAPAELPFAPGALQAALELTASGDAQPGTVQGVVVVARADVEGYDVTVESQPFSLEVKSP